MKIIVTGNSGFIAKHLIDGLQKRIDVDEIWGLGRSNTGDLYFQRLSCAKNKYKEIYCDLTNLGQIRNIMENINPNVVFHLAAKSVVKEDELDPVGISYQNYIATHNLLVCCPLNTKFVFASSVLIHGNCHFEIQDCENDTYPSSVYGVTKRASENLIRVYHDQEKIKGVILRLCATVGKGTTHGLLHDIIKKLKSDSKYLKLLGDCPGSTKPYIYIKDTINALMLTGAREHKKLFVGNVCPQNSITVEKVAQIVMTIIGINKEIEWLGESANWKGDNPYISANSYNMKNLYWQPQFPTSELAIKQAVLDILNEK